jgi:biotin transport system substrate-specific component
MKNFAKSIPLASLSRIEDSVVSQMLWITAFAALTAVGARIEIPHQPVPFTMQTLAVLLAGALLGPRNGFLSQILYLLAGIAGLPVFAAGAIGFAKIVGPTGGYLLAFPVAAFVTGMLVTMRRTMVWSFFSMAMGLLVIFTSGTLHLYAFYVKPLSSAFSAGFLIFSWWDVLKLSAAAMTYQSMRRIKKVPF